MTEGGVSVAETNAIAQDQLGYIWIGGSNGLARYDGHNFEVFRHDPTNPSSLSNNFVWDILVGTDGRLWVATNSGLNRFDPQTQQFTRFLSSRNVPDSLVNNDVYRLFEDDQGVLWVGTRHGLDRFRPATDSFAHYRHDPNDMLSLSDSSITAMYQDRNGNFWVGTARGLNLYQPKTDTFTLFRHDDSGFYDPYVSIRDLVEDQYHNLWVATDRGLYRFDQAKGKARHYTFDAQDPTSLGDDRVWKLMIDEQHQLWVATDRGGLNRYLPRSDEFKRYKNNPYDRSSLSSNQVRDIFQDSAGDYWVALFPSGVDFADSTSALFDTYRSDPENPDTLSNDSILAIFPGPKEQIWVGTEAGLSLYNPNTETFQRYRHRSDDPASLSADAVLAITRDHDGNYWFGTWSGGLNKLDPVTGRFTHYGPDDSNPGDAGSISSSYIWALTTDRAGRIWIGTEAGALDMLDPATGQFTHYFPDEDNPEALSGGFIRAVLEDPDGTIWVATINGLNRLDPQTGVFSRYLADPFDKKSLPHNSVASLLLDSEGQLWVGTEGGLALFDRTAASFDVFTTHQGLANNSVMGLAEDSAGTLWINTLGGLSRFDKQSRKFNNYNAKNGLAGNIMNRPAILYDERGFMLVGSTRGLTRFSPDKLHGNRFVPPVVFNDFKLFNRSVNIGDSSALSQHIQFVDEVELSHRENMFSIHFSALNFRNPAKNQYRYRMQGFDDQWIYGSGLHAATYTNLNPGQYTFTVAASNNSGVWNSQGKSVDITVLPPPWLTWWAYCLYVIAFVSVLLLFVHSQRRKVLFEQQKVKELRKLDRLKDEFLANTSHELRTPLNGIIGLTDSLLDDDNLTLPDRVHSCLKMISSSGRRLSYLINDILDFSKIRNRGVELSFQPTDLRGMCHAVCMMMRPLAEKKGVSLKIDVPEDLPAVSADPGRLEQVLYNLIGNAIKFTFEGQIRVFARVINDMMEVFIEDTGVGIEKADLASIFESFTQAQGHSAREYEGTGLGLAVAKNLIELHGGRVSVESEVGKGSTFRFTLRTTAEDASKNVPNLSENSRLNMVADVTGDEEFEHEMLVTESPSTELFKFHILVVDDDAVNRQVLVSQLALHNYRITEAVSGQEAVDIVRQDDSIDLVLLDVMMPRMTGYEAAAMIRSIKPVHELPIIFITAKHLSTDLVAGFVAGGNDFLVKPVSKNELLQRTKTHLLLLDVTRNLERIVDERTNTLNEARRSLEAIDNIVNHINRQHSLQGLAQVLLRESSHLLTKAYAGAFWLIDEDKGAFKLISTLGRDSQILFSPEVSRRDIVDKTDGINLRSGVHLLSAEQARRLGVDPRRAGCALVMVIETDEGLAGLLAFLTKPDDGEFGSSDQEIMRRLQGHAVSAVAKARLLEALKRQNQRLEKLGFTDQLTGLNNRRHLIKYLNGDIALSKRRHQVARERGIASEDSDLIFVLIDIDHFKVVNDTYGHNAGDCVLKQFSDLLRQVFRASDHVIRWGGEEFLVVVRYVSRDTAAGMVERFRQVVEETEFPIPDGTILRKTCSIGFSCFPFYADDSHNYTWEQVVEVADMALYAAKKSGRNAWVGICGHADEDVDVTFHELEHDLERFVQTGAVKVVSSVEDVNDIAWK